MSQPNEFIVQRAFSKNSRGVKIRGAIEGAWERVAEKYSDRAWWRRKSTIRGVMWEESVQSVIDCLSDDPDLKVLNHNDTVSFIADDEVFFRLKKAGMNLFSRNFKTPTADLFHRHEEDLFSYSGAHRVEVVHVFNRYQTELDWVGVVARNKKNIFWEFELPKSGADITSIGPEESTVPASGKVLQPTKRPAPNKADDDTK